MKQKTPTRKRLIGGTEDDKILVKQSFKLGFKEGQLHPNAKLVKKIILWARLWAEHCCDEDVLKHWEESELKSKIAGEKK